MNEMYKALIMLQQRDKAAFDRIATMSSASGLPSLKRNSGITWDSATKSFKGTGAEQLNNMLNPPVTSPAPGQNIRPQTSQPHPVGPTAPPRPPSGSGSFPTSGHAPHPGDATAAKTAATAIRAEPSTPATRTDSRQNRAHEAARAAFAEKQAKVDTAINAYEKPFETTPTGAAIPPAILEDPAQTQTQPTPPPVPPEILASTDAATSSEAPTIVTQGSTPSTQGNPTSGAPGSPSNRYGTQRGPLSQRARDALVKQRKRDWEAYAIENNLDTRFNSFRNNIGRSKGGGRHAYINGKWQDISDSTLPQKPTELQDGYDAWMREKVDADDRKFYVDNSDAMKNGTTAHRRQNVDSGAMSLDDYYNKSDFSKNPAYSREAYEATPERQEAMKKYNESMAAYNDAEKNRKRLRLSAKHQWEDYYMPQRNPGGFFRNTTAALISDQKTKDIINVVNRKY